MNIQEEILKIKEEMLEEFDNRVEALKVEDEFPKFGDSYHFMDDEGEIVFTTWCDDNIDQRRLAIGNIFRTEAEAEFAVEKLKVEAELRKFGRGYVDGRNNWYILYDYEREEVLQTNELNHQHQGTIYFGDTYTTREAIESVGEERIKKYVFGVE